LLWQQTTIDLEVESCLRTELVLQTIRRSGGGFYWFYILPSFCSFRKDFETDFIFIFYPLSNCLRLARSSAVGMAPGGRLISKKGEYYTRI